MQKILVHSDSNEAAAKIRTSLESKMPYPVYVSFDPKSTLDFISSRVMNLAIYAVDLFTEEEFEFVGKLRSAGYSSPILLVSREVVLPKKFNQLTEQRIHLVQSPYEEKELLGVTKKLMYSRSIPQQKHRRYRTNVKANVETFVDGQKLKCSMYDLSMGGAYFEHEPNDNISIGDMLRLKVKLDNVDSSHLMNAKVVWTTRKGRFSGRKGAGVKFLRSDDIYRQLMEKV